MSTVFYIWHWHYNRRRHISHRARHQQHQRREEESKAQQQTTNPSLHSFLINRTIMHIHTRPCGRPPPHAHVPPHSYREIDKKSVRRRPFSIRCISFLTAQHFPLNSYSTVNLRPGYLRNHHRHHHSIRATHSQLAEEHVQSLADVLGWSSVFRLEMHAIGHAVLDVDVVKSAPLNCSHTVRMVVRWVGS